MVSGKRFRISRLLKNGRMLCVPMDHGITVGPVKGIDNIEQTITSVSRAGATAVLLHKGIIKSISNIPQCGIIMHMSASTNLGPSPNRKVLITTVEEAIRLGVDAVSVHINIGCKEEPEMLEQLGHVADACDSYQLPLIAMMYVRGEKIADPADPDAIIHAARIGAEAGADIVKTVYTGNRESFRRLVLSCPVPVVLAGGPKINDDVAVLSLAWDAIQAGAMGVTFGRNIFQHEEPDRIVRALHRVVIEGMEPNKALVI
ncbi:MAG: 2-amino-3,7-dideoxy-D-threo-hept-6-ulosonate synthase [Conexivisphaerales archaeon]